MLLTFEKIREISLNEKQEKLQKLPPDFFNNAKKYLESKKGTIEENSTKNLVEGIFTRRQKKILEFCFHLHKTKNIPENLEEDEEKFYLDMVSVLRNFYDIFRKNILEQAEDINKNIEKQYTVNDGNQGEIIKENQPQVTEIKNGLTIEKNAGKWDNKILSTKKENLETNNENKENVNIIDNKTENIQKETLENNKIYSNQTPDIKKDINENLKQMDINKNESNSSDKIKVVFLKDVPNIISPDFEISCFKKGDKKELEPKFVEILKEKGLCELCRL